MLRNHVVHDHIHIHDISFGSTWLQLSEEKLFKLCQAPPPLWRLVCGLGPGRHQAQGSRSPAAQAATDSGQATPRGPRARHPWGHHPHRSAAPRVRSPRGRVASLSCTAVRLPCRCAPTKRSYPTPLHAHAKHIVSARPTRPTSHLIEESACTTGLERKQKALRHRAASFARHLVRRPWHEWHEWLRSHVNVLSDSQRPP